MYVFTVCNKVAARLHFQRRLSVILFRGGGLSSSVHAGIHPQVSTPPRPGTPHGRYTPLGRYIPWVGTSPRQVHTSEVTSPGKHTPLEAHTPWKQTVRILLECFFVGVSFAFEFGFSQCETR